MPDQLTIQFDTVINAPVNSKAEILAGLIESNGISERCFSYNSFRIRLSEIRQDLLKDYQVFIHYKLEPFTNKFGHSNKYKIHFLLNSDKQKAIDYYNKINKKPA